MIARIALVSVVAVALMVSVGGAAEPAQGLGSLELIPKQAVGFIHIPNLKSLEDDLKRFARETGWEIGHGEHPAVDLLQQWTGIQSGIDPEGCATVGFLNPKEFHQRYSVFVLPVSDWDAMLKGTAGEEMSPGLYALTGTAGPRFVARRGRYAIITSSVRTMDAVAGAEGILKSLPEETRSRAAGPGPMVYISSAKLRDIYLDDIAAWFRAATSQLYHEPEALAYADMLSAYLMGIAQFIDQTQTFEMSARFEPDGLKADLAVRFVPGGSIAKFMASEVPGKASLWLPVGRQFESVQVMRTDPEVRTELLMKAVHFFLNEAPRPEPLPETTKTHVEEAMQMFADSIGPQMTFVSAPALPGMGEESSLTILELRDPVKFRKSLDLMGAAWESLADQLNLYVRFQQMPQENDVAGVPVTMFLPRFRFGIPARHMEFRERMKTMYGPEGLIYRVAIVGNQALISSGTDQGMLKRAIEDIKSGKLNEPSPAAKRLEGHLPGRQSFATALSLPLFIGQALLRGGTPAEKVGKIDAGREIAGVVIQSEGSTARVVTFMPHEQIRLALELLKRAAPDLSEMPHTLFEPSEEGPPKAVPPAAPAAPGATSPQAPAAPPAPAPAKAGG
ncbi:MAG: hypothetical protein NT049_16695 [Planctomycetota bacterium]|nr:hypothetical protein [Planctomycetota bacterium]